MAKVDVLISGAGPIGLTMANELTRYGISVRIVDKSAERTDKSKALVLWSRTLELFDHAGYVEPFLAAGMQVHGAQMSNGKDVIARVSLDDIDSPYPYALMIPQSDTERVLEEQLAKRGVKVERTVALESFTDQGNQVQAVLRKASGESETLTADWLVGCDGAHSTVRHGLGFTFDGTTQPSDWYLADGHITGLDPGDQLHIFWHKDGILAFFPITEGRWRVIADLGPAQGDAHCPDPTLQEIQSLITLRGTDGIVIKDAYWLAAFRINERKVSKYDSGRAFLAGDAAHIHSPAGGQGMNTGMQDAFNLTWKLSLVIGGVCKPSLLDSYSVERSAVGDMVLRDASLLAELDIGYPESPLTVAGAHHPGTRKAGERWPDRLPADPGKARFTAIGPADAVSALATKFPKLVQAAPASGDGKDLRLVRPDGYVGFAGAASDRAAAEAYLKALVAG